MNSIYRPICTTLKQTVLSMFLLLTPIFLLNAQNEVITPPSPMTQSILRINSPSVNHYMGAVNVTIPFFSISMDGMEVPIGLNYTGSNGIRLQEEASWVGLGWSLTGGGVISRIVQGIPDELEGGYSVITDALPTAASPHDYFQRIGRKEIDVEPDIFSFSFPGGSGQFFLKKDGGVLLKTMSNLKIEKISDGSNLSFRIIDEYGRIYTFDVKETVTTSYSVGPHPTFNYSWYLSKITPHNTSDEEIGYEYESYTTFQENRYFYYDNISIIQSNNNYSSFTGCRLKKISFPNGSMEFTKGDLRKDVSSGQYTLSEVKVKDRLGNLVKHFQLNYVYNDNLTLASAPTSPDVYGNRTLRLKLANVKELSTGALTALTYQFDYNSLNSLPSRASLAYDHWGYYNGAISNTTPAPLRDVLYKPTPSSAEVYGAFGNANREPDENSLQAGLLKRVYYPTGGYLEIDYEIHRAHYPATAPQILQRFSQETFVPTGNVVEFTVSSIRSVYNAEVSFDQVGWNSTNNSLSYGPGISIYVKETGQLAAYISPLANVTKGALLGKAILNKGNYRAVFTNQVPDLNLTYSARVVWNNEGYRVQPGTDIKIGGVRVAKTKLYEKTSAQQPATTTRYTYIFNGKSSGRINDYPLYEICPYSWFDLFTKTTVSNGYKLFLYPVNICPTTRDYIGYEAVSVEQTDGNATTGMIEYQFITSDMFKDITGPWHTYKMDNCEDLRGLPRKETVFRNVNNVLQKISEHHTLYDFQAIPWGNPNPMNAPSTDIKGLIVIPAKEGCPLSSCSFEIKNYQYSVIGFRKSWEIDTQNYYNNTQQDVVTNTYYSYMTGQYLNPVNIKRSTSNNVWIETDINYSFNSSLPRMVDLKNRNVVSIPVEESTYHVLGSTKKLIHKKYSNYDFFGGKLYKSKDIETIDGVNLRTITYDTYLTNYRPTKCTGYDAIATHYEWNSDGYLSKITREGMITSYTYKPLVGLLTITDPRGVITKYEYDAFGRLIKISQADRVIESYVYNYRN